MSALPPPPEIVTQATMTVAIGLHIGEFEQRHRGRSAKGAKPTDDNGAVPPSAGARVSGRSLDIH
jgi:hypothetical protein